METTLCFLLHTSPVARGEVFDNLRTLVSPCFSRQFLGLGDPPYQCMEDLENWRLGARKVRISQVNWINYLHNWPNSNDRELFKLVQNFLILSSLIMLCTRYLYYRYLRPAHCVSSKSSECRPIYGIYDVYIYMHICMYMYPVYIYAYMIWLKKTQPSSGFGPLSFHYIYFTPCSSSCCVLLLFHL